MMEILVLSWAISFGVIPEQTEMVKAQRIDIDAERISTFATLSFGVTAWDRIKVYTDLETYQYLASDYKGFNPYRADYVFGADLYLTDYVSIGVVHECDHPVISSTQFCPKYAYLSAETKLFMTIGNKRK